MRLLSTTIVHMPLSRCVQPILFLSPLGSQTIIIILIERRASFHETFEYNDSLYAAREARAAHVVLVPPVLRHAKKSFH